MRDLTFLWGGALMGQIMIFKILERDGPLSVSIYTGARKILSIFLSIMWFEKSINNQQKISLILGLSIMLFELFDKAPPKTADKKEENKKTN